MIGQIIGKIIAHKAGIALGAAAVGVVATAVLAAKDARKYDDNIALKGEDILEAMTDEEYDEYMDCQDEDTWRHAHVVKTFATKKEKAIIFAKSYWRTGMAMAVTFGLMIFSHVSMAKELAATAAALGVISTKYKELAETLKEKYPDTYEKVTKFIDEKNIRKEISEKGYTVEGSYDGRNCYYEPETKQIFYATEAEFEKAASNINRMMMNDGSATLYDFLSYFPDHCKVNTYETWSKDFGWFQGFNEITIYEDSCSYLKSYIEVKPKDITVIEDGEKRKVKKICFSHTPDIAPESPIVIEQNVEAWLRKCKRKKIKEVA